MKWKLAVWVALAVVVGIGIKRNSDILGRKSLYGAQLQRTLLGSSRATWPIYRIAFSDDDKLVATGNSSGDLNVWEMATGRHLYTASSPRGCGIQGLAFEAGSHRLMGGGCKGQLLLHNVEGNFSAPVAVPGTPVQIYTHQGSPFSLFLLQNLRPRTKATRWGIAEYDLEVRTPDGKRARSKTRVTKTVNVMTSGAISPDGRGWVLANYNGFINFVDTTGQVKRGINIGAMPYDFKFYDGGRKVVAVGDRLTAYDVLTGQQLYSFPAEHSLQKVRILPGEKYFETLDETGGILLHDIATGYWAERRKIDLPQGAAAEFSRDGSTLITGSPLGETQVWRMNWF